MRQVAEAHGGSVGVEGSLFTLRLPSVSPEGADELRIEGKPDGGVATPGAGTDAGVVT